MRVRSEYADNSAWRWYSRSDKTDRCHVLVCAVHRDHAFNLHFTTIITLNVEMPSNSSALRSDQVKHPPPQAAFFRATSASGEDAPVDGKRLAGNSTQCGGVQV